MVPLVFYSTTLAYVPLNLCFDQTTPSLLSKHRRASTLKEPKELHLMTIHNTTLISMCVVKGEFLSGERGRKVIYLGYANQIKGLNKKYQLSFQPLFLDVSKISTFHKSQQLN